MTTKTKRAAPRGAIKGRRCPICGQPARAETRPFCSRRCAERDLGRWLGGAYRIPTEECPGGGAGGSLHDDSPGDDDAGPAPPRRH